MCFFEIHRITEWLGWDGTSGDHLAQPCAQVWSPTAVFTGPCSIKFQISPRSESMIPSIIYSKWQESPQKDSPKCEMNPTEWLGRGRSTFWQDTLRKLRSWSFGPSPSDPDFKVLKVFHWTCYVTGQSKSNYIQSDQLFLGWWESPMVLVPMKSLS